MSNDWIFIGVVYARLNDAYTDQRRKRFDLYSNTVNGEIVYKAMADGRSYFVSKNPYFGAKQPLRSSYTHMIMCEDNNYYLNI